ncbi:MAG: DUF1003 domain-containing protein [Planctomycetes bacterium]|nr:DUF1003 domain-containing protein [Planctomycetota bacterium]
METEELQTKIEELLDTDPLDEETCSICSKSSSVSELISGTIIRKSLAEIIHEHNKDWVQDNLICNDCISKYRAEYVEHVLEKERGELSELETEVIESMENHELLSANANVEYEEKLSFGDRITDKIVKFGGSWKFIILFSILLIMWMIANTYAILFKPIDPYPFIFMNFILSTLAAFQAPFVLMSQNRQAIKEKVRSDNEYKVNLKSELEIRHLNSKVDQLLTNQWGRLLKIQQVQTDLINEVVSDIKTIKRNNKSKN